MKAIRFGFGVVVLATVACNGGSSDLGESRCELTPELEVVTFPATAVGTTGEYEITLSAGFADCEITTVAVQNITLPYFSAVQDGEVDTDGEIDAGVTIPRGGTGKIKVQFAPKQKGFFRANVTVNVPEAREGSKKVTFEVRAQGDEADAQCFPRLIDFGRVEAGSSRTENLTIRNLSAIPLVLDSISFDDQSTVVSTSIAFPYFIEPESEQFVPLTYRPLQETAWSGVARPISGGVDICGGAIGLRANDCVEGVADAYDHDNDGTTFCGGDCDDDNAAVFPGGTEIADGADNDCNGLIDDTTRGYDDDGDGYCEHPTTCGSVGVEPGDCNDGDGEVHPGNDEECPGPADNCFDGIDNDCDGVVDGGTEDLDGDGYTEGAGDCDPDDPNVYPGAKEEPDGVDNDCDGTADEGTALYDDDGDGFCEGLPPRLTCTEGAAIGDCDDSVNPLSLSNPFPGAIIHPPDNGPESLADYKDNDCDGEIDEGTPNADDDGDGFTDGASEPYTDCNDDNPDIGPHMFEVPGNGTDEDCDPTTGP